tara:strand:+ start:1708 stop:2295 length:588 start_codon:yes stop_codon:yes gene_type:complete
MAESIKEREKYKKGQGDSKVGRDENLKLRGFWAMITRAAAKQLLGVPREDEAIEAIEAAERLLALREPVTSKADAVWRHRALVDVYTGESRNGTKNPQVDHVIEVQVAEMALVCTFANDRCQRAASMATAHATELLRGGFNGMDNLNVTSSKINQGKRGPFTAAVNRWQSGKLRTVSVEQLARQGRGKWMVDDGT